MPRDPTEAIRWFRLAAEQGLAAAQVAMGFMFLRGEGVLEDRAEAIRVLTIAAEQGNYFGHLLRISGTFMDDHLIIGGVEVHNDGIIDILEPLYLIGDVGVVIGMSATGGNCCPSVPFVISFAEGEEARFHGPLRSPFGTTFVVGPTEIRFESPPTPDRNGTIWNWTPDAGFVEQGRTVFVPDQSRGWADLATAIPQHPGDLFDYAEISSQLYSILGTERDFVVPLLLGVGSSRIEGDLYIGTGCRPHACNQAAAIVAADLSQRRLFVAWKPDGDLSIVVRPPVAEWPAIARAALAEWSRLWWRP